jgi:hypothetical protein
VNEFGSLKAYANDRDQKLVHSKGLGDALAIIITFAFARLFLGTQFRRRASEGIGNEWKIIEGVQATITSSVLLPGVYNWPSLTYLIALSTSIANLPASSRPAASRPRRLS